MKERHVVSTVLVIAFGSLALAIGRSPRVQGMAAGTEQQAQVRTVADITKTGAAMFSWLTDQFGAAAAGQPQVPMVNLSLYAPISHAGLETQLVPTYLEELPELDGWDHGYQYYLNTANPLASQVMAIRSDGRDQTPEASSYTATAFAPDDFDQDIVWADGYFVRRPGSRTDREAQERTVADIRAVATAMVNWVTDQVGLTDQRQPKGAEVGEDVVIFSFYSPIPHVLLHDLLVPQYIQNVPELDGWNHYYGYYLNTANPLADQVMAIRSNGRDKSPETDIYTVTDFDRDDFDQDIVWADGLFVRWPEEDAGLSFYALPPCRALDTRSVSALQSGTVQSVQLAGACGVPVSARSVAVHVTVAGATGAGYVTLFPAGSPVPATSTITFAAGQTRSSNTVVSVSGGGTASIGAQASVAANGQVHLILDIAGYFD